jgi:predicted membrane channel-forming protein YqfA (hemolysin III family)
MEIYKYDYNWVNEKIVYSKLFPRNPTDPLRISRWPIFVFLISALMCLFGSSMFHLFY